MSGDVCAEFGPLAGAALTHVLARRPPWALLVLWERPDVAARNDALRVVATHKLVVDVAGDERPDAPFRGAWEVQVG